MPELLLELFSEEIPARMQARAAEDLSRLLHTQLAALMPEPPRAYCGPRRLAVVGEMARRAETPGREERGPRLGAPDQAVEGFLRKHGAAREALGQENGFWVLRKPGEVIEARDLIARAVPAVLRGFPWPKSMRWGTSGFAWVRPLHRILCILDGDVVPFALGQGEDAAHGLVSGDLTEGHRVMAPGAFAARGFAEYEAGLRERRVVLDAAERARLIRDGVTRLAAAEGLEVVPDEGLVAEVAGLVEWPAPLLGRIDDAFMDLPVEVMRTTMRVNQRYFTLRRPDGSAAPRFALVANIEPADGGAAVVGGNERVLRARLSDARFFWDQDRKHRLEDFLPRLEQVVFHARLGTQGERVRRLEWLAGIVAPLVGADPALATRAALLAKADLASGMVGEFPELQGIMGRHYALHGDEDPRVAEAIGAQYRPLGPTDDVPREPVAIAVALADKLDQLAGFFAVGERPTGSGDPFALRRAALGVIRIVRENGLRLGLQGLFEQALRGLVASSISGGFAMFDNVAMYELVTGSRGLPSFGAFKLRRSVLGEDVFALFRRQPVSSWAELLEHDRDFAFLLGHASTPGVINLDQLPKDVKLQTISEFAATCNEFLFERLRVQLRAEGARHDLVAAVFGAMPDDDLVRLLARAEALGALLESPDGANLLTAYRRAANILRIEDRKDGPHRPPADPDLLRAPEEVALAAALAESEPTARARIAAEDFTGAMAALAALRAPVDAFFDRVTVNDPEPRLRRNRLALLAGLRAAMDAVADLSKIEG